MRRFRSSTVKVSSPQGALAWLLAGLVFTLSLLSASPDLHAKLHAHDHDEIGEHSHDSASGHRHADHVHSQAEDNDDGCAIVLFGNGVTTPLALPQIVAPAAAWSVTLAPAPDELLLSAPRYLSQPGRGPPANV